MDINNQNHKYKNKKVQISCIGDSITYGVGTEPWGERCCVNSYTACLQRKLGDVAEVKNFGASGYAVTRKSDFPYTLWWKYEQSIPPLNPSPDIVIMMLGSNDAKTVFDVPGLTNTTVANWDNKADFISDYIDLINTYRAIPSNPKIFICTTCSIKYYSPDHKVTPEVINFELQKLIREVARQANLPLINVHSAMTGHENLLEDGIHPNNEGAMIIADTVYNAIYDTVKNRGKAIKDK